MTNLDIARDNCSALIDTHCHIHDRAVYDYALSHQQISRKKLAACPEIPHTAEDFSPERIIARAKDNGIQKIICIGTNHTDSIMAQEFAANHSNIFWSYGIHPEEHGLPRGNMAPDNKLVAIGEVGLDYHQSTSFRTQQIKLLEDMLELAQKHDLPLIFHVREAFEDFWSIIDNVHVARAVIHSFSDSHKNLQEALNRGFFIGINGLATFADLYPQELPPLDKILLETDAPFLAPVPNRGQINEPAHIKDVAGWLSNELGLDFIQIAKQTTANAERLFRI